MTNQNQDSSSTKTSVKPEANGAEGNYEELLKLNPSDVESIHVLPEGEEAKEDEPKTKYKFGSTQVNLPEGSPAQVAIKAMQDSIPDSALAGDGKDVDDPHATIRYGLKTKLTPELRKFIESQAPFEAKLGTTISFPPSKHSDGAAPIVAPVVSDELHRLNREIEEHGDFAPSSFPEYKPHITVAYVNPEVAKFYEGMTGAEGKTFPIDSILVSDQDGDKIEIPLKGETPSAEQEESSTGLDSNTNEIGDGGEKPEQPTGEDVAPPAVSSTIEIQGGTKLASAPSQEPVVKTPTTSIHQVTKNVMVPLVTAMDVTPVVTKSILPVNTVKALAEGLNPERTVKSVHELLKEAESRSPNRIIP